MPTFQNDPVQSTTDSTSAAVIGENTNKTKDAGPGVHGTSAAAGVFGESTTWHGVAGISQSTTGGAGVFGQGSLAGRFQGDVDITGNLTIQGVSIQNWLQRIVQLEHQAGNVGQLVQQINSLEQKATALQNQLNSMQNQLNTAISNLTGRVTLAEVAISALKGGVAALEGRVAALGG